MKWEINTLGGFLRRIAIDYVRYGYMWYVIRSIPADKDPVAVEARVLRYYEVTACRVTRLRRKQKGQANVVLVRFGHTLVVLATQGKHRFFDEDAPCDIRLTPLHFRGYSIGLIGKKPCVLIAPRRWKAIRRLAHRIALHNHQKVSDFFERISPFSFPGIVRQRQKLLKEINTQRKRASLSLIQLSDKSRYQVKGI